MGSTHSIQGADCPNRPDERSHGFMPLPKAVRVILRLSHVFICFALAFLALLRALWPEALDAPWLEKYGMTLLFWYVVWAEIRLGLLVPRVLG